MAKVPVNAAGMKALLEHARTIGTADRWPEAALEWMQEAEEAFKQLQAKEPIVVELRFGKGFGTGANVRVKGKPDLYGSGCSACEAIGDLMKKHPELFNAKIVEA